MSIRFGDILQHNNPNFPIADITDIKGGLRSIATFSDASLLSEFTSGAGGTQIPEKYKSGYSLLLETSTDNIYYLSGISATTSSDWRLIGGGNVSGITGSGTTNSIVKWTGSTSLGDSLITDNGDTVTVNGNLMVIGTTLTVFTENLLVKDPIILLAGSQSGVPTYDAGLFINRGSSDTQAFIWDESETEFKFITTTSGATVSGNVSIGTYSSVRTGVLSVGTGSIINSRFLVSSSGGTVSLIVDEDGYVYNRGRGNISTNTAFGLMTLGTNTTGSRNTAFGASALSVNTTGSFNTTLGHQALMSNLSGSSNIAIGHQSLNLNISGSSNIAVGVNSLRYNRASFNTAIGRDSLQLNTIGSQNTAVGYQSLSNNTSVINTFGTITPGSGYVPGTYSNVQLIYATGSAAFSYPRANIIVDGSGVVTSVTPGTILGTGFPDSTTKMTISNSFLGGTGSGFEVGIGTLSTANSNTAVGFNSLLFNSTGSFNTAIGEGSLDSNSTGNQNTGIGNNSLSSNTTGNGNVAVGRSAMLFNTTGLENTAVGWQALPRNTTSDGICAFGRNTLFYSRTGSSNSAFGNAALYYNTLGSNNTAFGSEAGFYSTTGVASLGTFSGGNGYTPGTYSGVQLIYSGGTFLDGVLTDYPLATIVVGSTGSITSVTLETTGQTFQNTSTIMTSTATEIGPGNGFTIQINSIQTANNNTAIGYHSLRFNTIGSNNTALGFNAGSSTILGTYSISDNSVFIGYNTKSNLSNETNQIVIGCEANGNGSNTVTLGNDSIIKTYLKGKVQLPTIPTTSGGSYSILTRNDVTGEVEKISPGNIIWYGQSGTVTPNAIHYLSGSGWTLVDASNSSATGVLAIALGSDASDGMLLRGIYKASTTYYNSMTIGGIQFLSTTSGEFSETAPSATTEFVRIIGYCLLPDSGSGGTLYFSPDSTWVELS